ncbi:MAG: hypothetical protein QM718_04845 [Steroidobacteraceae bacterium]
MNIEDVRSQPLTADENRIVRDSVKELFAQSKEFSKQPLMFVLYHMQRAAVVRRREIAHLEQRIQQLEQQRKFE